MAGESADDIMVRLETLPFDDRQRLLCLVCSMREEIARTCWTTGLEVSELLTRLCSSFVDGQATCLDATPDWNHNQPGTSPQEIPEAHNAEHRREHRFKPNQTATVAVQGLLPGPATQALVLDVSGSGMHLHTVLPMPCGARVKIELNGTVAVGTICRCEPEGNAYDIGVEVSETAPRSLKE